MLRKLALFAVLFVCSINTSANSINNDYEQAITAFYENKFDAAYIHLKNSLDKEPSHLPSKVLMGKVLALSLYYSEAIIEFEEALLDGADPNLIIEFYANALIAERLFEQILTISDDKLSAKNKALLFTFKANASQAIGNEDTEHYFSQALSLTPNNPVILNSYARYLISNGKFEVAQSHIDKALNSDSKSTEALRTQALLYKLKDNDAQYIKTLESTIEIDSEQPFVLRDLVIAYLSKQNTQKARSLLERILVNSEQDFMARLLMSYIDSLDGNFDESSKRLERLVNDLSLIDGGVIDKTAGLLYVNGLANFALGNTEKATLELAKYLTYQPSNFKAASILADLYVENGNLTAAINTLLKFPVRLTSDIELIARVCGLYIASKANIKCSRLLIAVDESIQYDPRILSLKAQALSAQGKNQEGLDLLRSLEQQNADSLLTQALLGLETGQMEVAAKATEQLLIESPSNQDYLNLSAGILIKQGRFAEAENTINKILINSPKHFEARYNLASVYFNQGKLNDAKEIALELLNERNQQVNVLYLLASIDNLEANYELSQERLSSVLDVQKEFRQARVLKIQNHQALDEFSEALKEINTLLQSNFLDPELLRTRVQIYAQLNNSEDLQQDLNTLYTLHQDSVVQLVSLAELKWRLDQRELAISSVTRALTIAPNDFFALRLHARYMLLSNKADLALSSINTLNSLYKENPDVLLLNGDYAIFENDLVGASEFYERAILQNKSFEQALFKRYQLALRGVAEDSFTTLFKKLFEESNAPTSVSHYLADFYLSREQLEQAKNYYSLAQRDTNYSNRAVVLNNLSYVYQVQGDYVQSINYAKTALSIDPNNNSTLDTLGWSMVMAGNVQEGLNLLRQSYSLNTSDPNVQFHIAFALEKLGRKDESRQMLDSLLSQYDNFRSKEQAESLLSRLAI